MKIVIDIPDGIYKAICDSQELTHVTHIAIKEGTPLPKGHGRLIDADELYNSLEFPNQQFAKAFKDILDDAPTIIEADRGEEDE